MKNSDVGVIKIRQGSEVIEYMFVSGTTVCRRFRTVDMRGKHKEFQIVINDEKGILSCKPS